MEQLTGLLTPRRLHVLEKLRGPYDLELHQLMEMVR
jgi:hypothetical protein